MRTVARLVSASILVAAAGLVLPTAPASAAACSTATGVTVVVDFNQLGGGVQEQCDASGGGHSADSLFNDNGVALTYARQQAGFVCRVSGVPTSDPCVNTSPINAYWSLYWSDGESGQWFYASTGAKALTIPDGGYVAFSWKQGSAAAPPSTSPTPHAPAPPPPTPTPEDTSSEGGGSGGQGGQGGQSGQGGNGGNGGNGGSGNDMRGGDASDDEPSGSTSPSTSGSASPSDSVTPSPKGDQGKGKDKGTKREPSASPSSSETSSSTADPLVDPSDDTDAASTASPPDAEDGGLPGWVAPGLIAALFAAAGVTVLVRRRGAAG